MQGIPHVVMQADAPRSTGAPQPTRGQAQRVLVTRHVDQHAPPLQQRLAARSEVGAGGGSRLRPRLLPLPRRLADLHVDNLPHALRV